MHYHGYYNDGCGREYYQTIDFGVGPVAPVALDKTAKINYHSPATGVQALGISLTCRF
jgi:hypothetical protein